MTSTARQQSTVTIHMAASLDGFVARTDGRVDWLDTHDEFDGGISMDSDAVAAFLKTIDCYVMGSRTYETASRFAADGLGWAYGDTPTFVLTTRELPRVRESVHFRTGDLSRLVNDELRVAYRSLWVAGGPVLATEMLRLGLADELRYTIVPVVLGDGIPFFARLDRDVALHLTEVTPHRTGMVELRYTVHTGTGGATQPAAFDSRTQSRSQ